jgi:UDP-N-acetylmuramate dehydrogenase
MGVFGLVNKKFLSKLYDVLDEEQVLLDEPMKYHTTFKIGGPADYLLLPSSVEQARQVFKLVKAYEMPLTVLGNGSNVLVLDKGIRGAVVKFDEQMAYLRRDGEKISAGSGALLKSLSEFAAENVLTGLEFAIGIPGSVGGAVFMNAGAYDGDMGGVVSAVTAVDLDGNIIKYAASDAAFGYRHSIFQENKQIVCEVEFSLKQGEKAAIYEKMADFTSRRESKQPLEMPSAGSTFKRPQGYFAGTLIEKTGLKGLTVGGAQVSEKHAGFVVNTGSATAADVLNLIKEVQRRVYEAHGVNLQPEVRIVGE